MPNPMGWQRRLPALQSLRARAQDGSRATSPPGWCWCRSGSACEVASGLPGIYGLYATIVPLLAYPLFGPSCILVGGRIPRWRRSFSASSSRSPPGPVARRALAPWRSSRASSTFWGARAARLRHELLFKPILYGYMNGIALMVLVSRLLPIASAMGLFEVADLIRIYRIQRWELWLSILCFVGVAVLGRHPPDRARHRHRHPAVPVGWLAPSLRRAGPCRRAQGLPRYHALSRRPADPGPGPDPARMGPCFSPNAELFKSRVLEAVARSPAPARWCVVTAEPVTSVDVTAAGRVGGGAAQGWDGAALRRTQGPGQGEVQAIRPLRAVRARAPSSPRKAPPWAASRPPSRGVCGLGGPRSRSLTLARRRASASPF